MDPIYISVILATYNDSAFIKESIESILKQTYPYFELIIVNDGSTDNTLEIVNEFIDDRIIIIDKPNTGLPDSLNVGLAKSRYEWVARMDGDDVAMPTRFERQVKMIKDALSVIGGNCILIDKYNKTIGHTDFSTDHRAICFKMFCGKSQFAHPSTLIRKSSLLEIGGYDTNFRAAQDIDLWYRLSSIGRLVNTSDYILKLRKSNTNISSNRKEEQTRNSIISFAKYSLGILKPITPGSFDKLTKILINHYNLDYYVTNLIGISTLPPLAKKMFIMRYYLWRIRLFLSLFFFKKRIRRDIGS